MSQTHFGLSQNENRYQNDQMANSNGPLDYVKDFIQTVLIYQKKIL